MRGGEIGRAVERRRETKREKKRLKGKRRETASRGNGKRLAALGGMRRDPCRSPRGEAKKRSPGRDARSSECPI